jgi:transcriptional regulator with XRE-family HTH domain
MTNEAESIVGAQIRSIRERRKVSLRTLADRCGLSANATGLIEHGENSPALVYLVVVFFAGGRIS